LSSGQRSRRSMWRRHHNVRAVVGHRRSARASTRGGFDGALRRLCARGCPGGRWRHPVAPAAAGPRAHPCGGHGTADPARAAAGPHPDAEDAHRSGLGAGAVADGGSRPEGQCLRGRAEAPTLDQRPAQRRRDGGRGLAVGWSARVAVRPRDGGHDAPRSRARRESQPHHAAARCRRRWRGRAAPHLARGSEPALRHGAARRHVLCGQYRWRGGLSVHRGRHHDQRTGSPADHLQARWPLDAQPAAQSGRAPALHRCRLAQQHRRPRHDGRGRPRLHLRVGRGDEPLPHLRRRPAQPGGAGSGLS